MNLQNSSSTTLLLLFLFLRSTAATKTEAPASPPCSDELQPFSACLPYISSSSKNKTTLTPPIDCCDGFSSAFSYNNSACLCYLLHQPRILGFPVNSSRLYSISSLCPLLDDKRFSVNTSDKSLCSGSPRLLPLHSITGPVLGSAKSNPEQQSQAHITDSPSGPNSDMPTSTRSSAIVLMTNKCRWVPLSVIFFFTYIVIL